MPVAAFVRIREDGGIRDYALCKVHVIDFVIKHLMFDNPKQITIDPIGILWSL